MKTHYELLGVDPAADIETIKKAFRREIARYHPDKVTHLGLEFQEMASTRSAELTAAYKALSDAESRADYDATLQSSGVGPATPSPPPARSAPENDAAVPPSAGAPAEERAAAPAGRLFEEERAGRDDIVRRAVLARLTASLQHVLGDCDVPTIRGFDLACVPRSKPITSMTISSLFRRTIAPVVLVRIAALVDAALATDAWTQALRVRMENKAQPLVLLLLGHRLAPARELARAIEDARRKSPASQDTIFPVPIDLRDWTAKIPVNAPEAVRNLVHRLKSSV